MLYFVNWLNIEFEKLKKDGSRISKNYFVCGFEFVLVIEILCLKEGVDVFLDFVKNWIDGFLIGG